jgi:hypothetical protein
VDKNIHLWPHIDLEDLLVPQTIPWLLSSAGRNPSGAFAAMDWDSTGLGCGMWAIKIVPFERAAHSRSE